MDDRRTVAVTGYGVFSCFGRGPDALRSSVFAGVAGFGTVSRFVTSARRTDVAATAPGSPVLGAVFEDAARDALAMSGFDQVPESAAVLLGTQGAWGALTDFWGGTTADAGAGAIAGTHAHALAGRLGLEAGRRRVFTNACVSSANAIAHGADLVAGGRADIVLAGGGYLVDQEFFAKFDSGRAFARDGRVRPFSTGRSGLLLGDGVGIVVLEDADTARRRGAEVHAVVAGAGMSADSHHVCRPHPGGHGLAAAMTQAIRRAGLDPADIDYVNAHGTGTPINDPAETAALRATFGAEVPPVSSTKGVTGHCLEGAGALETIICLIAMRDGVMPPTAGFLAPDPDCEVDCIPGEARRQRIGAVLSASLAFGGANAALVLTR